MNADHLHDLAERGGDAESADDTAPPPQLLTMTPQAYVCEAYAQLNVQLAQAIEAADGLETDAGTPDGHRRLTAARAGFRTLRLAVKSLHRLCKAPVLEIGRLIDARAKELEALIAPYEQRYDATIKAEAERRDTQEAERLRVEQARSDAIIARITAIRGALTMAAGQSVRNIGAILARLRAVDVDDGSFAEFTELARGAKLNTLAGVEAALQAAVRAEGEPAEPIQVHQTQVAPGPARVTPAFDNAPSAPRPRRAAPRDDPMSESMSALLHCHGYLTGRHNDHAGALARAERALRDAGIPASQLNQSPP